MIYTLPIEQSDWSECYNHGTIVNKSHKNAVITNDFFLLVYVIILFVLYILHILYYYGILGGGGGGIPVRPPPLCVQPCIG